MSKKTLWILVILSLPLTVIGIVAYAMTLVSLTTSLATDPTSAPSSSLTPDLSEMAVGFGIAIVFLLAGGIIALIGRVGMLIRQAKQQQWAWFVCTLLLGWICLLIYLIVWPETPQPVLSAPVYAAQYQPMPLYQAAPQFLAGETAQQQGMPPLLPHE